jgi:light-regulated signal transduction histidine kinase (bacteriophytochrome)
VAGKTNDDAIASRPIEGGRIAVRPMESGTKSPVISRRVGGRIFGIVRTPASRDDVEPNDVGLAIAKNRARPHSGRIRVERGPPARGTTIAFTWKEPAL